MTRWMYSLAVCACLLLSGRLVAQGPPPGPDMPIDLATVNAVVEGVIKNLTDYYVFPDVADKMGAAIRERQQRHEYDRITSARTLAETLTSHLRDVSHDKHLSVGYSAAVLPPPPAPNAQPSPEDIERMRGVMSQTNFGFEKIERLAGNIGYLDLRGFGPPQMMGDTAAAAMNFLANADALIIDLRQNGGGSPDGVALMASYLMGPQPARMNDIYDRPSNETHQFWTLPYVPGKRLTGKDVYLLTSNRTFSAAEDFSYGLKNLKRVTIVGEVTGGGAHPGGPRRITDHFFVATPSGRSISVFTKTDWEGVGVEPDVNVPAARALTTAHLMALEKRATTVTNPRMKAEIDSAIERLKKESLQ
jgi:retinol-binding protein 3